MPTQLNVTPWYKQLYNVVRELCDQRRYRVSPEQFTRLFYEDERRQHKLRIGAFYNGKRFMTTSLSCAVLRDQWNGEPGYVHRTVTGRGHTAENLAAAV
jgi:hypothetical protein